MNASFFNEHDNRINGKLARVLRWIILVPIAVTIVNVTGLFELDLFQLFVLCSFSVAAAVLPAVLFKLKVAPSSLKYAIVIVVSLAVSVISVYPTVGIYITLILGVIVSLCYSDYRLTFFACVLNYVLMLCGQYFRMSERFLAKDGFDTVLFEWMGYSIGYTMEFLVVCPIFIWIAHITRGLLNSNLQMISSVEEEQMRQNLIMGSSNDILYEYDLNSDVLKYYGSLTEEDRRKGKNYQNETCIENFHSVIQNTSLFHKDDINLFFQFIEDECRSPFVIRLITDDGYIWFDVNGNMIYDDNHPVKCIGRIKDVTEAKMDEQEYLMNSSKDGLTGFYNRRTGLRILRQQLTEAGRHDSQIFLYVRVYGVDEMTEKKGKVFADAILLRIAEILRRETSDMDLPIRFSEKEFILYLANRTAVMMERMMDSLDDEMSKLYTGEETEGVISFKYNTFSNLKEIEQALLDAEMTSSVEEYEATDYRDDLVSFAFNLLERTEDFESAIRLLLDRIGGIYMLDYIRVLRGMSQPSNFVCIYEWIGSDSETDGITPFEGSIVKVNDIGCGEADYVCDCGTIGDRESKMVFCGRLLSVNQSEEICYELECVAQVVSIFLDKKYVDSAKAARTDFLTTMSHEIRTPMNAIAGFAELIADDDDIDQVKMYADSIRSSAHRLVSVLDDILDMSKIEAEALEIIPVHYYLHEITEEVKTIIGIQLEDSMARLVARVDSRIPDGLVGDGVRIRQIFLSILSNAVNYTRQGEIGVEIYWDFKGPSDGNLIGIVWDTGIGIKESDIEKVFDPYFRTAEAVSEADGTGLGLSITKRLVEMMNGSIRLESTYGRGTKVTVTIPQGIFDRSVYDYDSDGIGKAYLSSGIPFTAPWARVMIVDDNQLNLSVANSIISKYKVSITEATSGKEVLEILKKDSDYDLIFMDYMMPDLDGIQTTQLIRGSGDPVLERIPIVALTANVADGIEEKVYMAGMNGYLSKPINLQELAGIMLQFIPEIKREG